ncbi:hypothetical protein BHU72_08445 [Desulfuribacillus stibiiarsenatis]|uniref:SHOCT domain-containing protein n=2 Tax=Desulfuribacillus stibiiarsenatis TaxID=1390249 RepID=A0A1E5L3I7_9FIRM|nr:hypothetical protein BHU72_08445 [Desulfuribacillus stibiiarsenatis]
MGYGHMGGVYGFPWMMVGMMIFWALLILAGIFMLKSFISGKHSSLASPDSLEILKIRLVKGEINEEEYLKLKELITK